MKLINFLAGKKTYIVAFLMVLVGIINALSGDLTWGQLLQSPDVWVILNGLGLGSLRAGVSKLDQ